VRGLSFLHVLNNTCFVFLLIILIGVRWYLSFYVFFPYARQILYHWATSPAPCVLICISLMINDVLSIFSCTLWLFVCLLLRNLYSGLLPPRPHPLYWGLSLGPCACSITWTTPHPPFSHCLIMLFVFLQYNCLNFLHILDIDPLLAVQFANIFFYSTGYLFTL
jgi:hypothetical protein